MKKCAVCGTGWKEGQKACPECDSEEFLELNGKLKSSIAEVVEEVVADMRYWIVEVEFEVDEGTDAETMMKWLLDQVKTFEDNYEGHNLEIVPVVGGGSKFNYITMYWRFSLDDGVLAVAMTQRLVEVRDDDQLNTNDMDFIVGCRYEEDADDLE